MSSGSRLLFSACMAVLAGVALTGCGGGGGSSPQVQPGVYETTTIATFGGSSNSLIADGDLTRDAEGNLYGMASTGSGGGSPQVYKIDSRSHAVTTVATVDALVFNLLADRDGNVFGWERVGGQTRIVKISRGSGTLSTLATFDGDADPRLAHASVTLILDGQGNLYGTFVANTSQAPYVPKVSEVFEIPQGSNTLQVLASFPTDTTVGTLGSNIAVDSQGNVFGTLSSPGGAIWKVASGSHTVTTVATITQNESQFQDQILLDSAGNIYGTTISGNPSATVPCTVCEVPRSGSGYGALQIIGTLPGQPVIGTVSNLALDRSGNVYGIRSADTASGQLEVYKVNRGSGQVTDLAAVGTALIPHGMIQVDDSGNVFGTVTSDAGGSPQFVFEVIKGSSTAISLIPIGASVGFDSPNFVIDPDGNIFGFVADDPASGNSHLVQLSPVSRSVKSRSVAASASSISSIGY